MKRKYLILLLIITLLGVAGCQKEDKIINKTELVFVNKKIINYFSSSDIDENLSNNLCFNYIDEKNQVVVVGLLNNTKKKQKEFKKKVIDSKLIKFIQGSKDINLNKK